MYKNLFAAEDFGKLLNALDKSLQQPLPMIGHMIKIRGIITLTKNTEDHMTKQIKVLEYGEDLLISIKYLYNNVDIQSYSLPIFSFYIGANILKNMHRILYNLLHNLQTTMITSTTIITYNIKYMK